MNYMKIAEHYDKCFETHGDTNLGVDWPKKEDTIVRYTVMEEVVKYSSVDTSTEHTILDFGCGAGHFLEYIINTNNKFNIIYTGLDINQPFVDCCKSKFYNNNFICMDILDENNDIPFFDFIVANGVFTEKLDLSHEEMMAFFMKTITKLWEKCNLGLSFNLMSKHVDWERSDLFHVSLDELGWFLKDNLSRNFIIRNDYKLYEYTVYVYKE